MKINIDNWKEFKIRDVFNISRGQRLVEKDRLPGEIEYYSASEYNNALTDKISNPLFIEENAIIYTTFGDCFYVDNKFTASDEVSILKHDKLNIYNGLFLSTLIKKNKYKYFFGRKAFYNKFSNDIIKLPVIKSTEEIDWDFMESYIKKLSENIVYDKKLIKNFNKLNLKKPRWEDFGLIDIFDIKKGERLTENDRVVGDIPLITASSYNNGITNSIDFKTFKEKKKIFEDKITIDMFGNVFYQNFKYFSDDNVHTLFFKNKDYDRFYKNKYINIFIISILKELSEKYGFGRQVRIQRLEKEVVSLPINKNGKIDFEFMEKYIKSLPYSSNI